MSQLRFLPEAKPESGNFVEIPASGKIVAKPLEQNMLTVDFCDIYMSSVELVKQHVFTATNDV